MYAMAKATYWYVSLHASVQHSRNTHLLKAPGADGWRGYMADICLTNKANVCMKARLHLTCKGARCAEARVTAHANTREKTTEQKTVRNLLGIAPA